MCSAAPFVTLFLWFGVPTITNGRPNIAGQLALRSPRECTTGKIVCTVSRFTALDFLADRAGRAGSRWAWPLLRRNWTVVTLAAMAAGWVVIEIAFALHGFPGVPRYLFEPAGLTGVLAGSPRVGWCWTPRAIWRVAAGAGPGSPSRWSWSP